MTKTTSDNYDAVKSSWNRLDSWLNQHTPQGRYRLKSGASLAHLQLTEATVGAQFPEDLRESFLLHDGSEGTWVLIVGSFLSLDELANRWKSWHEGLKNGYFEGPDFVSNPEQGIKSNWFNNKWIPVSDNQNGDYTYVDLDPAEDGQVGQVIGFTRDEGATKILAKKFGEWISGLASALESGMYLYDESDGELKRRK